MARAAKMQAKAKSLYRGTTSSPPSWQSLPRQQQQVLTRLQARVSDGFVEPVVGWVERSVTQQLVSNECCKNSFAFHL